MGISRLARNIRREQVKPMIGEQDVDKYGKVGDLKANGYSRAERRRIERGLVKMMVKGLKPDVPADLTTLD